MLKAINRERRKNDEYKEQLPILIERLQYLSEACIKKEELIKTQGEYMQSSESQIYELQLELRQKDLLIRELNKTIVEQRDYLEKNTYDNSESISSFDSKLDGSIVSKRRRRRNDKNQALTQREEDLETIEGLKDDIKQLLKEYKLIERQKDDLDNKYQDSCKKNEELIREILNMEQVIEDQDHQIISMRDKLQNQMKEITHSNALRNNLYMMKDQLNPALDYTETDLNKSANISQQITLENFKAGRIGPREPKNKKKKVDRKALKDALNLSYQIINPEGERREQSMIEDKIVLRKSRGISPFGVAHGMNPLINRNKEGNNTDSTTAEGNSKGNESSKRFVGRNRIHSIGDFDSMKQSQSIIQSKRKLSNLLENPEPSAEFLQPVKPEVKRGHVKNQESVVTLMGDKIHSPEVFKKIKVNEDDNELSFKNIQAVDKTNDSLLLQNTINRLKVDNINQKPETSALNFNESQFNFGEDSQMNDIIEISHFAKPSEIGRFLEGNDESNEHELARRFRKYKPDENENQRKSDKTNDKLEELTKNIKNEKQDIFKAPENFPDLDTSDIAFEAPHHFDKEFGDKDDSFVGFPEHNSFEAEANNAFVPNREPFAVKDFKPLSTPQVSKSKGKFTFPEEIEEFSLNKNKRIDKSPSKSKIQIDEEVKVSEMKEITQLENKISIILADEQDQKIQDNQKQNFKYENPKKQVYLEKIKKNQNAYKIDKEIEDYKMELLPEFKEKTLKTPVQKPKEKSSVEQQIKASIINFDDDEFMLPTNKRIQDIFEFHDKFPNDKVVSIVDDFGPDDHNNIKENNKMMDSMKSSLVSSNSEFSNCDKISERMADIIIIKDGVKEDVDRNLEGRKRGHKKNVLTMNRILPAPGEIENYLAVRSPPEEEFFLMTLMCYKLNHQHFCKICDINGQRLFIKASKDMKLPFFKFPEFIEKELDTAYLNLVYQKRKKKHLKKTPKKLTPLQQKQRLRVKQIPAEECKGKVLDDDYDIDDEYF